MSAYPFAKLLPFSELTFSSHVLSLWCETSLELYVVFLDLGTGLLGAAVWARAHLGTGRLGAGRFDTVLIKKSASESGINEEIVAQQN